MVFIFTSKFLPGSRMVFRSLLFIVDKMGDLSLLEPEPREIAGLDIDHFQSTPVQVSLARGAQLELRSSDIGQSKSEPLGDHIDYNGISCPKAANLIYKPLSGFNSDSGHDVFMVGQRESPPPTKPQRRSPGKLRRRLPGAGS
jgi:hypothetical protein